MKKMLLLIFIINQIFCRLEDLDKKNNICNCRWPRSVEAMKAYKIPVIPLT